MKQIFTFILLIFSVCLYANQRNEKEIETKVDRVTVFAGGAQIFRSKQVYLPRGESLIKFVQLSSKLKPESININCSNGVDVFSVRHEINKEKREENLEIVRLKKEISSIKQKISKENLNLSILNEELRVIKKNRENCGNNDKRSFTEIKGILSFYNNKVRELKENQYDLKERIKSYRRVKDSLILVKRLEEGEDKVWSEILVRVKTKQEGNVEFEINYFVDESEWYSSYDIKALPSKNKVLLQYKANVSQRTFVDWNDVKIRLSSEFPNHSVLPTYPTPHYIGYNSKPPIYNHKIKAGTVIKGRILDSKTGETLTFVNIIQKGKHKQLDGATSDFNGEFSMKLHKGYEYLEFTFVGYNTKRIVPRTTYLNVYLDSGSTTLNNVAILEYKKEEEMEDQEMLEVETENIQEVQIQEIKNNTSSIAHTYGRSSSNSVIDFETKSKYSISSDGEEYTIPLYTKYIPASYKYYCMPRASKDVFISVDIPDWEKYNLIDGNTSLFLNNTYIGNTFLDISNTGDTLNVPLGIFKGVSTKRSKLDSWSIKRKGSQIEATIGWKITLKNHKKEKITLELVDQIPVSNSKNIEVELIEGSGAKLNKTNGILKWNVDLNAGQEKTISFQYFLKYPRCMNIELE
ncbi:MAG: DUF4139 domain-containing protein [Hyphomicrobiales bacterium]